MLIDSNTLDQEVAEFFRVDLGVAKYVKRIIIDEVVTDTKKYTAAELAQIIETAKRFAVDFA
jgi:hypothetical protein